MMSEVELSGLLLICESTFRGKLIEESKKMLFKFLFCLIYLFCVNEDQTPGGSDNRQVPLKQPLR